MLHPLVLLLLAVGFSGPAVADEVPATRLYADDGTSENVLAASLRWTRKF